MTGTNSQVSGRGHTVDEHGCEGEVHDGATVAQDGATVTDSGRGTGVTSTTGSIVA